MKKYIELAEIDNASNILLKKKRKEAFHVSYIKKLKLEANLICYKHHKLIGKIFDNNNLDIDVCFTNLQLEESLFNNKQYDYERFSLNSKNELENNNHKDFKEDKGIIF